MDQKFQTDINHSIRHIGSRIQLGREIQVPMADRHGNVEKT